MQYVDVPLPFAQDSVLRTVFKERIVQLSGLRAILMQGLSPSMVAGFLQHSDMFESREKTIHRLLKTGEQMNRIYFSDDVDEIQMLCAKLRKGHSFVQGTLPTEDGSPGKPYRADDPEHLLWVIACIADSAWSFYARWRGENNGMREAFWREYRIVGRLFGLQEKDMPTDWQSLQIYIESKGRSFQPLPEAKRLAKGLLYEMSPPGMLKIFTH